jgi:hypothetical protein
MTRSSAAPLKPLVLVALLEFFLMAEVRAQIYDRSLSAPRDQASTYKGLRDAFLDHTQRGDARARRLHEMVMTDADQAGDTRTTVASSESTT